MEKIDIHNYRARFDNAMGVLERSDIPEGNKKLIKEMVDKCVSTGISIPRTVKYVYNLANIAKWKKKPFKKFTEKDITSILSDLYQGKLKTRKESRFADSSIEDFKKAIKKFFKSIGMKEIVNEDVIRFKNIKTKVSENDIWTDDEVEKLICSTTDIQDRAWVEILCETGCRIGELGNNRIKDVVISKDVHIKFDGKTGEGVPVLLISSVPSLMKWLSAHPDKDNPNAPLWVIHRKEKHFENGNAAMKVVVRPKTYGSFVNRLYEASEIAGIKKPINTHIQRHNITTKYLRAGYNPEILKKRMRWSPTSRVLSTTYSHLTNADVDNEDKKARGIEEEVEKSKPKEVMRACPRCKLTNRSEETYCIRCGSPMSLKAAIEKEESKKDELKGIVETLMENKMEEALSKITETTVQARVREELKRLSLQNAGARLPMKSSVK